MSVQITQIVAPKVSVPVGELFTIATEYVQAGRLDAADRLLGHILTDLPRQSDALHLRGLIAFRRGETEQAATTMEQAFHLGARQGVHLRNLSEVYRLLGRLDEAAATAEQSIKLTSTDPLSHFNLAMVRYDRLEFDASIAAGRQALARDAAMPQAHMKLAQSLLVTGAFAEGWSHYEWRFQIPGAAPLMPATERPLWDGKPLPDGRLLLIADQGYGDVIMFGRFFAWAKARCRAVTVACSPELQGIVGQLAPGAEVIIRWEDCRDYAAYVPFSGLPLRAGIGLGDLPGAVDYVRADPARVAAWKARLDAALPAGRRRIAIAWAGRPTHNNDRNRSMALRQLAPLAGLPDTIFLSLQKGPAAAQCQDWAGPAPLVNLDAELKSFEDSAAILALSDLLICVDTSMAHLAGAMGRPAWVMLPYAPDWRWLVGREDTPWYPSLRLFRQTRPKDWASVVERVRGML